MTFHFPRKLNRTYNEWNENYDNIISTILDSRDVFLHFAILSFETTASSTIVAKPRHDCVSNFKLYLADPA